MPQDRKTGAAWDWVTADLDSAHLLGGSGVAWEFLRRNDLYQQAWERHGAGEIVADKNRYGVPVFRIDRPVTAAQTWGLQLLVDPRTSAASAPLFWQAGLVSRVAYCTARPSGPDTSEFMSLASFGPNSQVLRTKHCEHLVVRGQHQTANLIVQSGSILLESFTLTFHHEGFATAARHAATVSLLAQLMRRVEPPKSTGPPFGRKYRDYLTALDGHLAGRSYRAIAEQLYGADRVRSHWTDDTRWMKSKVRRAVERGVDLMNGGYRELL